MIVKDMFRRGTLGTHSVLACLSGPVILLGMLTAVGQESETTIPNSRIDRSEMRRQSGPQEDDTTGTLSNRSGSYVTGAVLQSSSFVSGDGSQGRVSVEIVKFPSGYKYAPHDLFGLLSKANNESISIRKWDYVDRSQGGIVCSYNHVIDGGKQKGGVLWYHGDLDEGIVTVIIGYTGLDGAPGMVIDEYLRQYPSDVPEQPTWHNDWETKDLEKWIDVLNTNKNDLQVLQAGAAYLTRYDKRSFGLLDALRHRENTASSPQALDDVISRLSEAAAERKLKSAQPDKPKD